MNFSPITAAGLTGNEAAHIFKVSRVAFAKWIRKANPTNPHKQIAGRVEKILRAIEAAVEAGALPVPANSERIEVKPKVFVRPDVVAAIKAHLA